MKRILFLIAVYSCFCCLYSQSNIQFFSKLDYGNNSQTGIDIATYYNGKYYTIAYSSLGFESLERFTNNGICEYKKMVLDTVKIPMPPTPSYRYIYSSNKFSFINGSFFYPTFKGYGGQYHFTPCMVRIDTAGNKQIWDYTFNNPTQLLYFDQLQNHYIYAQGETNRDTANPNYMVSTGVIMQLDTSGAELWRYNYTPSGTYRNAPAGIRATPDSGCVALFYIGPWSAYSIARLMKLDKNGQLQWQKTLPIPQGILTMSLIDYNDSDSSVVVQNVPYMADANALVISPIYKIDKNMQIEWTAQRTYNDSIWTWRGPLPTDSFWVYKYPAGADNFIKAQNGKGYIGCGSDGRDSLGHQGLPYSGYVLFINDSGRKVWEATYHSADHGMQTFGFTSINTTSDGGYILTGNGTDTAGHQIGILVKIDSLGCLTADSCETRLISSITYYTPEQLRFSLYPNPATTTLHLAIEDNKKYEIVFYNLMGQKIHSQQIANKAEIDVQDWTKGIYFYQLLDNGKPVGSGKVMKE